MAEEAEAQSPEHPGFVREGGALKCDGVSLDRIAEEVGTPVYVYSAASMESQYRKLSAALARVPHRLHFSVKANSNLAVLGLLRRLGAGVDIVSGGEMYRAQSAGFDGGDIVFSGVGKTVKEMREALTLGVLMFNVESEEELALLDQVAGEMGKVAPVALRVNPEVMVDTPHPYTRTGVKGMKFGIPFDETAVVAGRALTMPNLKLIGLDMHVGSQISQFEPYEIGLGRLLQLKKEIQAAGAKDLQYLDIGGGLAVSYDDEHPIDLEAFGAVVEKLVGPTGLKVIVEPGRFLVGNAGALVTRVLYRKRSGGKEFIIVDAGMNDLIRPSHYNAYHRIEAVKPSGAKTTADIVGPVCESGDFMGLHRDVDDAQPGELMAVLSAGAYGYVMSSNYNSRPRLAEVLVKDGRFGVVTEREQYTDLVRRERLEPEWRNAE
ncbi:MAG TPA: diaminopimelate decarboxylase [Gemmatimonadaceae bacterium]|nr:diaminopimelate decarboxylase [Gemmatimonadaceae bacterium]